MSTALLHHILKKRAQYADPEVDGYSYSKLLPPVVNPTPATTTALAPKAIASPAPAPVGQPKAKTKVYIPPPAAGQQTKAQRAAWEAAIKAQGGQGVPGGAPILGFGPKP